jgi:hypothetical protein
VVDKGSLEQGFLSVPRFSHADHHSNVVPYLFTTTPRGVWQPLTELDSEAIERRGHSGCQAIGGAKDEGERNNFFPNLAPKLFNFFNKLFFPGLFNNAAFCLTPFVSFYMSLSAPCVGAYSFFHSAMGTGSSRDNTAIRKMTNWKGERESKQEWSRPL